MPKSKAPWEKPAPSKSKGRRMTEEEIQAARERAAKAGRRYPNLVDNMAILRERNK